MSNVLVLMSAPVPTIGHADLLRFASNIPNAEVGVLVSDATSEGPISLENRADAIQAQFPDVSVAYGVEDVIRREDYQYWKDFVRQHFGETRWDYVVASESYGGPLACALQAQFIPYDLHRTLNPVTGTEVRANLKDNWSKVLPEARPYLSTIATLFGQESVGKTTLSKLIAESMHCAFIPEYARLYLEHVGPTLNYTVMSNIVQGQYALQMAHRSNLPSPTLIQDTDLFSTLGYYRISGITPPPILEALARRTASDLYFILPDDVPFEDDILRRYSEVPGQRESTVEFWVDICRQYNLNYRRVPEGHIKDKEEFITSILREREDEMYHDVKSYIRQ